MKELQRARRATVDRRFRHRLFQPQRAEDASRSTRLKIDKSFIDGSARRRERQGRRHRGDLARPEAQSEGHRRGRRNRRAGRVPARQQLRRMQGYHFSRPVAADAIPALLLRQAAADAVAAAARPAKKRSPQRRPHALRRPRRRGRCAVRSRDRERVGASPRRRRIGCAGFARRFRPKDDPKRRERTRRSGVEDGSGGQGPQSDRLRVEPRAGQSLRGRAGRGGLRRDDQRPRRRRGWPRRRKRSAPRPAPRFSPFRRSRRSGDARRAVRRLSRARHSRQQQRRAAAGRVRRPDARDDPRRASRPTC